MIFDALSNAAYRVSLRGPGAEIEGGVSTTPPAGGGKSRGPAGRGLNSVTPCTEISDGIAPSTDI